jgi:hypothetical protein
MKRITAACLAALALGASAVPAFAAAPHSHDAHESHGAPSKITLDHGRKWATDEALRRHMGDIRGALAAKRHEIHRGKLDAEAARQLGATIEKGVAGIVADCKLPPEADANLHVVVADLVAAADVLQGRSPGKPAQGATKAVHAVNQYGRFFEDPGFRRLD